MWTISLPLSVAVSRKKQFVLNLNRYRNAHFQLLNKAKIEFERVVRRLLKDVPRLERCTLEYVYYHGKGAVPDTNNVLAVQDKFFQDTLVSCKIIPDDGPRYVVDTRFRPGSVDKKNPRVDVTIRSTEVLNLAPLGPDTGRKHNMKFSHIISLSATDVQVALKDFVVKHFPQAEGSENMAFTLNGDGTYETRVDTDPAQVGKKGAKTRLQPADAMAALKTTQNTAHQHAEPPKATQPGPLVAGPVVESMGMSIGFAAPPPVAEPLSPFPAAAAQEPDAADSSTPEAPPPGKKSIFSNFTRVQND